MDRGRYAPVIIKTVSRPAISIIMLASLPFSSRNLATPTPMPGRNSNTRSFTQGAPSCKSISTRSRPVAAASIAPRNRKSAKEAIMQRRDFLASTMALVAGARQAMAAVSTADAWRMPDEGERQAATWMAFGANDEVWGTRLKTGAQANLARIARTIASVEAVKMLVNEEDYDLAARLCGNKVQLLVQPIDDLWMRDTGPVFV